LVTWTTNELATTEVEYATSQAVLEANNGLTAFADPRLTTPHGVFLAKLTANTTYYYRVRLVDGLGNSGYSTVGSFTTDAVPGGSTLYDAPVDFSTVQGTQNWTYRDNAGLMGTVITSGQLFDTHGASWQGNETFALLWFDGGHPGTATDVIRRWTAPAAGSVSITGVTHTGHPSNTEDGVRVIVRHNGSNLADTPIQPNDWTTYGLDLVVPVQAGDTIDFVINKGGANNTFDSTFYSPTIVFTP
jgi:hypothetical protein